MNRIQLWPEEAEATSPFTATLDRTFLRSPAQRVTHTLFAPLHYEPNYAYPLLVWLHGPGDDERQLQRVMPLVSMRNYVAAGPRGVCRAPAGMSGFAWQQTERAIALAEERVFECVEAAAQRFNVASARVFLGGYQCGGTMAVRIALAHPGEFAGALSVGGAFPEELAPLRQINNVRGLPLFFAQGRASELYPMDRCCNELRLFHAAGMSVTVRQYPCGDELTTKMLGDMNVWMMERVTGVPASCDEEQIAWCEFN